MNGKMIVKAKIIISRASATSRICLTNSYSITAFSNPLILKYFSVECGAGNGGNITSVITKILY